MAVLYRTNAQARLLEERMVVEGIPYRVVGGTNFYSRQEIKDILAYLKTIDNASDEMAVRRIVNVPKRGIGATTIEKIADYAEMRDISLYEAMCDADNIMSLGKTAIKIEGFVNLIRVFRSGLDSYTISDPIKAVIERTEYMKYLEEDEETAEDRIANLDELITKAVVYEETHNEPNLSEFLEEMALVADIDNVEEGDNRVLLMTLHSAKGLEFPVVYLAGMEDGLFPSFMTIMSGDQEDIEEERRLAYVGITRAKEELNLTCAKMRMVRGETQYNAVSRFIREIPEELMDNKLPSKKRYPEDDYSVLDKLGLGGGSFGSSSFGSSTMGRNSTSSFDPRPKAVSKPKVTAKADKPFIARGIGSLNNLAGVSKGAPVQQMAALDFEIGDRVKHIKYGEGVVTSIVKEPRDYKVTVQFDDAGQKIMYASFAKLKRV